jgi:hypothetical protein
VVPGASSGVVVPGASSGAAVPGASSGVAGPDASSGVAGSGASSGVAGSGASSGVAGSGASSGVAGSGAVTLTGPALREALELAHRTQACDLSYRQVYLTPERNWTPLPADDVMRRRYGDCKDLARAFIHRVGALGLEGFPVLNRIVDGRIEEAEPVSVAAFNHVIVAVRLPAPLGFASEVETPRGRFLLVDPTGRYTPLGMLPEAHRGRRLMIATPDGAIWVTPPDAAIVEPRMEVEVAGQAHEDSRLELMVRIREHGNALGLRELAATRGRRSLEAVIDAGFLRLPPEGRGELVSFSEPADLAQPFEVVVRGVLPGGMRWENGRWTLSAVGIPGALPSLQPRYRSRETPIDFEPSPDWTTHIVLELPFAVRPVLPTLQDSAYLQDVAWQTSSLERDGKTRLELRFSRKQRASYVERERVADGARGWQQARNAVRQVRSEGLMFDGPAPVAAAVAGGGTAGTAEGGSQASGPGLTAGSAEGGSQASGPGLTAGSAEGAAKAPGAGPSAGGATPP